MRSFPCRCGLAAVLALAVVGCQHYEVTDVDTGKSYVTRQGKLKRNGRTGVIGFTDLRTDRFVTLTEYEMERISKGRARAIADGVEVERGGVGGRRDADREDFDDGR